MNDNETAIFARLSNKLAQAQTEYARLDSYYNGQQTLDQLGLAIPPELHRFVTIVNWPRMGVDAVEERLDMEGFRLPDEDAGDEDLWRVWQANDLDEDSELAHIDSMIYGRSFAVVGANENDDDTPIVTVESPTEMTCELDPRTRKVTAALRLYDMDPELEISGTSSRPEMARKATLYLANATVWIEKRAGGWEEADRDDHDLGAVPVVPLSNRPRISNRLGVSEMNDLIPITDAAARSLTNLQLAQETHAVPQRGVLGASKGDFVDQNGEPLTVWQAYFGSVWAMQNENAKTFQFEASDLKNFETAMNLYARQGSALTGLPAHYFGFTTDNPASADAIRSSEARLVKRCERKASVLSGSWEQVGRLIRRIQSGEWDPRLDQLEAMWRNPATPTVSQQADAVQKMVESGVTPIELAWEDLGWSPQRRRRAAEARRRQIDTDLLGTLANQFREEPVTAGQ